MGRNWGLSPATSTYSSAAGLAPGDWDRQPQASLLSAAALADVLTVTS